MISALIPASGLLLMLHRLSDYLTRNHQDRSTSHQSIELLLSDLNNGSDSIDLPRYKSTHIDFLLRIDAIYRTEKNCYQINPYVHLTAITRPLSEAASGVEDKNNLVAHPAQHNITYLCPYKSHLERPFLIAHYEQLKKAYKSELNQIHVAEIASAVASLCLAYNVATGSPWSPPNLLLTLGGAYSALFGGAYSGHASLPLSYQTSLFLPAYLPSLNHDEKSLQPTNTTEKPFRGRVI